VHTSEGTARNNLKMSHHVEVTDKQKQRKIQAQQDLEMEKHIIDWIDNILHQRPPAEDEENYIKFIK
jgi:molybdenum cofactor biosynthesis enzyme